MNKEEPGKQAITVTLDVGVACVLIYPEREGYSAVIRSNVDPEDKSNNSDCIARGLIHLFGAAPDVVIAAYNDSENDPEWARDIKGHA